MVFDGINQLTEKVCLYCKTYAKIHSDYPVNPAVFNTEKEVPRCSLHSQYTCSNCQIDYHFNGIAWCDDCSQFNCLHCGGHKIVEKEFLVYDYYYNIGCTSCENVNATLEFGETVGMHPYQTGGLRPEGVLQVWMPFGQEVLYKPEFKTWGNAKLRDMTIDIDFENIEEKHGQSKEVWDANAEVWKQMIDQVDLNHELIIIPKMLEFMDQKAKKVMDAACGEGNFTRHLAEAGYEVTGTDVSNLIKYAIENEREEPRGIDFQRMSIHELKDNFDENSFDQVTCNMAMMDIDNLDLILENIRYILKSGGQFVFSITHPITAWPVVKTVKMPRDSQHNEDKGWLIDNYAAEQPTLIHMPDMPSPMLYYPRKLSTYVNSLARFGFTITQLSEPVPDIELIKQYPRHMFRDYERNPIFMIFQTQLLN